MIIVYLPPQANSSTTSAEKEMSKIKVTTVRSENKKYKKISKIQVGSEMRLWKIYRF